jgi:hypothetical protein
MRLTRSFKYPQEHPSAVASYTLVVHRYGTYGDDAIVDGSEREGKTTCIARTYRVCTAHNYLLLLSWIAEGGGCG